jgi:hypothetical protein
MGKYTEKISNKYFNAPKNTQNNILQKRIVPFQAKNISTNQSNIKKSVTKMALPKPEEWYKILEDFFDFLPDFIDPAQMTKNPLGVEGAIQDWVKSAQKQTGIPYYDIANTAIKEVNDLFQVSGKPSRQYNRFFTEQYPLSLANLRDEYFRENNVVAPLPYNTPNPFDVNTSQYSSDLLTSLIAGLPKTNKSHKVTANSVENMFGNLIGETQEKAKKYRYTNPLPDTFDLLADNDRTIRLQGISPNAESDVAADALVDLIRGNISHKQIADLLGIDANPLVDATDDVQQAVRRAEQYNSSLDKTAPIRRDIRPEYEIVTPPTNPSTTHIGTWEENVADFINQQADTGDWIMRGQDMSFGDWKKMSQNERDDFVRRAMEYADLYEQKIQSGLIKRLKKGKYKK